MNVKLSLLGIGLVVLVLSMSSWTPVVIISTHPDNMTYYSKNPQIVLDASGNSYVTWQGYDGNDQDIFWVKIDNVGTPGIVEKISIHPDNIETDDWLPHIAVDAEGNSYITWDGGHGNDYDIYMVKIDASGEPGTIQKLSHPEDIDHDDVSAQIAVDASGNSYVTWQGYDGNDVEIYWARIDSSGTLGGIQKISTHPDNMTHHDYDPLIAIDASGNSYVVWHGCDKEDCWKEPGDLEIYWVKVDSSGTPGTAQKIPPTDPDNMDTMAMIPQLAVDASGNSHVVWSGKDETSYNIYWVRIDSSGNMGSIQRVSAYLDSEHDDVHPEIAVDVEGNLYITWEGSEEKYGEIYWVRIDSAGKQGTVQRISNYLFSTSYEDWDPQIAVDAEGNSYVTWNSCNRGFAEKFDQQICWVKIDAKGNPGKVQRISSRQYSKHFDRYSQICVDSVGNSYVIWVGHDESKHDHIFFTAYLPNQVQSSRVILLLIVVAAMIVVAAILVHSKIGKKRFSDNNKKNV